MALVGTTDALMRELREIAPCYSKRREPHLTCCSMFPKIATFWRRFRRRRFHANRRHASPSADDSFPPQTQRIQAKVWWPVRDGWDFCANKYQVTFTFLWKMHIFLCMQSTYPIK